MNSQPTYTLVSSGAIALEPIDKSSYIDVKSLLGLSENGENHVSSFIRKVNTTWSKLSKVAE